ncbi:tRNA-specific adenosine deaminase, chloroplastic [Quillaja saponaria]|uniref:tRNA(adenine(34)) deaminase n=1 Tax=Quillaja saponaria TaxID=32244 RepID=A0AAD7KNS0_QUISA|nr:tRNA-specific adenosine deaminase, chloroplastic [Quillaja saponaria]
MQGCHEVNCSLKERSITTRNERRNKARRFCTLSEEDSEIEHAVGSDDAEAVLSLLSEEVGEEFIAVRGGRNGSSYMRLEVEKRRNLSSGKEEQVKKRGNFPSKSSKGTKKNVGLGLAEGNSNHREKFRIESREEDDKYNEERGAFSKGDKNRRRRDVSSCSSYYSLSSTGDFESDTEVDDKREKFVEEISVGYAKDKGRNPEDRFKRQVTEEFNRHRNDSEKLEENMDQQKTTGGVHVDWDLRKKSEKNLNGISRDETQSRKEQMQSIVARTHESTKANISHKQFKNEEDKSPLVINLDKRTGKQNGQTGDQVIGASESRRKYQSAEIPELCANKVETTSKFHNRFSGREENLDISDRLTLETSNEHWKMVGHVTGQDDSDSVKKLGEKKNSVLCSVQETKEQYRKAGEPVNNQSVRRRKPERFSEFSRVHESNIQSKTRTQNCGENSNVGSTSASEAEEIPSRTDKNAPHRIQSRKGSEVVKTISEVHDSEVETIRDSQRTSDKARIRQRSNLAPVKETRESHCQTDDRITQFKPIDEAQRPATISKDDKRNSQATIMPLQSQSITRGPVLAESTTGILSPDIYSEGSEIGSSAFFKHSGRTSYLHSEPYNGDESGQTSGEPVDTVAPEDSLGSADRLQKLSTQFVGEFVEKVRHEVTTSDIQKEMELTGIRMGHNGEKYQIESSSQYGTQEGFQVKEQGSGRSPGGSRAKGPSDEIWDVTDPSEQQVPEAEETEVSVTANTIVKRTGRSMWSIIADIVLLRWGSRGDVSNSAEPSGEKSSSNKSGSSEVWFSGHEHDETDKNNVARQRTSMVAEATPSHQLQVGMTDTQIERKMSDPMKSKAKVRDPEADTSSSNILGTSSGVGTVELPSSLPAKRSPVGGEVSYSVRSDISKPDSVEQIENPVHPVLTEISGTGRKDVELKQRKLQRNKQVPRDSFDEWEEAYKLEREQKNVDEMFMREALLEAKKAADSWEVPVGAVLVQHGKIIARGCNLVEELRDSTAHAEIICIREASNLLRTWRLADSTLYVTLEPCAMCAGAILQARIESLVWGAPNKLLGADGSWVRLFPDGGGNSSEMTDKQAAPVHPFHPKMNIRRGVLASECADAMQQFFQRRRKKEKKAEPTIPPSHLPVSIRPSKILTKLHHIFHILFCL